MTEKSAEKTEVQDVADPEKKMEQAEGKPAAKRRGRPRKESDVSGQTKAEKKREYKQVEVPQDFLERVHGIVEGHTSEEQKKYDKVVAQAILSTKAKHEFLSVLPQSIGCSEGWRFVSSCPWRYEKLKAAAAVNRHEEDVTE